MQLCILNCLDYSFTLLKNYKQCLHMRQRRHKIEETATTTTTTAAESNADTLNSFEIHYDAIMRVKIELVRVLLEYGCDPNRGLALTNRNKFVINMDSSLLNSNNYNPRRCSSQNDHKASANNYDDNNNSYSLKSCEQQQQSQHSEVVEETSADATIGRNASRSMSLATANALATAASHHITSSSSLMLNTDVSFVTKSLVDEKKFNALNATPIDSPLLILCCVFNCHNLANLNAGNSSGNSSRANFKRRDDSTSSNGINSKKNQTKASSVSSSSRYSTSSKTRTNRVNSGVLDSNVSKIIQQQQQQKRQRDHHQYNQQHRRHTIQMTSTGDGCGRKDVSNLVRRQQSDEKHLENNNCKINESLIPEGSEVVEEKNKVRPLKTILLICFKSLLTYPESLNPIQGNA